jgi:hypothetical protein
MPSGVAVQARRGAAQIFLLRSVQRARAGGGPRALSGPKRPFSDHKHHVNSPSLSCCTWPVGCTNIGQVGSHVQDPSSRSLLAHGPAMVQDGALTH